MNSRNRYGQPFYSAVDYQILYFSSHVGRKVEYIDPTTKEPILGEGYAKTVNTSRLSHKSPNSRELIDNIKNLRTWGLKVDVDKDIVFGKDGVLIFLIDKKYETVEQLANEYSYVRELLDAGYELKIGAGFSEKSLYPGYEEYETRVALPKIKDSVPNKNGLYCTNYKEFSIPLENIRYTKNANIIRVACGLEPIYDPSKIKDNFKDYEDLDLYPEDDKRRSK